MIRLNSLKEAADILVEMDNDVFLNLQQTADLIGVGEKKVLQLLGEDQMPYPALTKKHSEIHITRRWSLVMLLEWMSSKRVDLKIQI